MKINCRDGIITKSISYCSNIDNTCKELKEIIIDNHFHGYDISIILENESEYDFMKVFMNIGLYYRYDKFLLDTIEDTLLIYELNNHITLYIPNEEAHNKVSYLTRELEKIARWHGMEDDLKSSSIYRMLSYAQWKYENIENMVEDEED